MKLFVLDGGWLGGFAVIAASLDEARTLAEAAFAKVSDEEARKYLRDAINETSWKVFEPGAVAVLTGDH